MPDFNFLFDNYFLRMNWYEIKNIDRIDSPALVVFEERIEQNIQLAIQMVDNVSSLRPHVKTNKTAEVCSLMLAAGITKFKCATIAEAEMLALIKAPDVLLAYQPVGPKINRFLQLVQQYPATNFSCLIDDETIAATMAALFETVGLQAHVFIDLNVGMNRSGIQPAAAGALVKKILQLPQIKLRGLHLYDGQITDTDIIIRKINADAVFEKAMQVADQIKSITATPIILVVGGSPTFPIHAKRKNIECSPGTFVFWDAGYSTLFPDENFICAALLVTRVISIIDEKTCCLDLGHKSVAAENPQPRVQFLNGAGLTIISQSEEHLVVQSAQPHNLKPGDLFYIIPWHICPTVALYDTLHVVRQQQISGKWKVVARDRSINI